MALLYSELKGRTGKNDHTPIKWTEELKESLRVIFFKFYIFSRLFSNCDEKQTHAQLFFILLHYYCIIIIVNSLLVNYNRSSDSCQKNATDFVF